MNTPAISSPAIIATAQPQSAKQADSASPDASFNQVLSREIKGRDGANENSNANPKENANAAAPAQAPVKSATKTPAKEKSKDASETDQADASDAAAAAAAAVPADMLALVANISQIAQVKPDAAAATDAKPADAAAGLAALGLAGDAALPKTDASLAASKEAVDLKDLAPVLPNAKADTKDAAAKPEKDFAAVMQKAGQPGQTADAAKSAALQDVHAELAGAAAATVKLQSDIETGPIAPAAVAPLQQAVLNATQAVQPTEKLTPNVGTAAWDQALGQKVVWMVAGGQQSASLTLNPPDLGPLQVVLNVTNSQASATFIAAQPEVRQALEAAMPKLREMLGDAGIQLGQANVSAGTPNQNNAFGESSQTASRSFDGGRETVETTIQVPRGRVISSGQGLVDTFA